MANSTWLAMKMGEQIRMNPFTKAVMLKEMVKEKLGIDVTLKLCRLAKQRAIVDVKDSLIEHYSKLWSYVYVLCRTNPGSRFVLKQSDPYLVGPPKFSRIYICFNALKRGFREGCRKIIGLDGCFLKTWVKGELLSAIRRDANNEMYPFAWVVVEKEDQYTWGWFLNLLIDDIGMGDGAGWTVLSDQQKELEVAFNHLFPQCHQRNCARHIYANLRKKFPGNFYRQYFWRATKATTEEAFQLVMEEIKKVSTNAYQDLIDRDPSRWSKAFFPLISRCDCVDNNMCESFNSWILSARYKPLITMLEDIRKQVMIRMRKKREQIRIEIADGKKFGKKVYEKLEQGMKDSRLCTAVWNGDSQFEIGGWYGGKVVDLNKWTCTCRSWQLTGILCCHAMSTITCMRGDPEAYVSDWLKIGKYLTCYETMLQP